jgi:hypothetical protein
MTKIFEFKKKKKLSGEEMKTLVQENLDKMSRDEIEKILVEDFNSIFSNFKEFTCVWSFFNFLIDKRKEKVFATTRDSLVGKHKANFEKQYGIKIIFIEVDKNGNKKENNSKLDEKERPFYCS